MAAVVRLLTFVDIEDVAADARQLSVSARHEAVLADGQRVLLLGDRGWTWSAALPSSEVDGVPDRDSRPEDGPDFWSDSSVEDIVETARVVVGPDEPPEGRTREDMEVDHWDYLSGVLRQQGIVMDALDLRRLPHEVMLSERLLAHIAR